MHMADALLAPAVAGTMYVLSGTTLGVSVHHLKKEEATIKLPTMAVTAALVFAGQMVNYTIPGTGSSGHICGGMLLTVLLGPWAGFLSMAIILTIQCLLFADGGLLALGANMWNMAFYGCFVGYYLIWRPLMHSKLFAKRGEKASARIRIVVASIIGCIVTLQLGAFSVVLETSLSRITELPFTAFVMIMQPIHLAIGLVEGLVTAAVLVFLYETGSDMLVDCNLREPTTEKVSRKTILVILTVVTVLIGGVASLYASSNPDGLEWALFENKNMALDEEQYGINDGIHAATESAQNATAILPDYDFADGESSSGTTVSGLLGGAIVAALAVIICLVTGAKVKKRNRRMN